MHPKIVSSIDEVVTQLEKNSQTVWVVLEAESFSPHQLDYIDCLYPGRSLDLFIRTARGDIKTLIERFFSEAVKHDFDEYFGLSAGVPLSLRKWRDIEILLGTFLYLQIPDNSLVILVASGSPVRRLTEVYSKHVSKFISPLPLFARLLRTVFRRLLLRSYNIVKGRDLWVSVGTFLESGKGDTYFARWPWQTGRPFVRIYMQGGFSIRLGLSEEQLPIEALLNWSDIWTSLRTTWNALTRIRRLKTANFLFSLIRILWREEVYSGEVFTLSIQRLAYRRAIDLLKPCRVIVPYEGRAWENILQKLSNNAGIKTIGYQHSSLTKRHLAILGDGTNPRGGYDPDLIICCGEITAQRIISVKPNLKPRIRFGAALRSTRVSVEPMGRAILLALSSTRYEALAMFRMFSEACRLGLKVPIIIRPHPTIPVTELFNLFEWPPSVMISRGRSLNEDIADSWCVAYSSSTVVLEGMLLARIPLFVDIGDVLSGDPLDDLLPCRLEVENPSNLLQVVESTLHDTVRCASIGEEARNYAKRYLLDPTPERISLMTSSLEKL